MRFVLAMMKHETNTFSPVPTGLGAFDRGGKPGQPPEGDDAIRVYAGTNNALAAYLDLAKEAGAEIVIPVAASANPSAPVETKAFEYIAGRICDAVRKGCDALFLDLHGAMVTEASDDGEGELLRRISSIKPDLPIAVALDFHTNLTADMIDNCTVMTGYCTYPHVDVYDTGKRAGRTLLRALKGEVRPVIAWKSIPILSHTLVHAPSFEPMRSVMAKALSAEQSGKVLNASVFGGFPLADIPHVGLSAVVVTDGDRKAGHALVEEMLDLAWQKREGFVFKNEPAETSIARAKGLDGGPVVLVDHGDNTASGGSQDVMAVLKEVMRQGLEDVAAGPFRDPVAVAELIRAGVGATVTIAIGGKTDIPALDHKGEPLTVTGTVRAITDGRFKVTGPMATGMIIDMGRTAVIDTGTVQIVVSERRSEPFDLGTFTHCGIDPRQKRYVLIKSRQHFRAGFEPIAKHIVLVDGPGATTADFSRFKFKNIRRPLYPIDWNER
jgi:microcystin degradation protein MlrC